MRKLITVSLILITSLMQTARAVTRAVDDQKLVSIIGQLNNADGYTYQVTIATKIIGNSKEKDVVKMTNFQSKKAFIVYSKSDDAFVFVCDNGQFRINPKEKAAYYTQYPSDPAALEQQKARMMAQFLASPVDSFFLKGATLISKVAGKDKLSYKIGYDKESMIKGVDIVYDTKQSFFSSIRYVIERPMSGSESLKTNKVSTVQQVVTMDQYKTEVPADIDRLVLATKNIKAYLEATYKGYKIEKINL